jgi:RNA polymerase sigma factor (sigma-70 family)
VELLEAYKTRSSMESLSILYQRYMEMVYGVCLKYLKDSEDAKDAVINIFEELVTKLQRHEVDNFKGWLYQVSRNHCLMILRSKKAFSVDIDTVDVHSGNFLHLDGGEDKEMHFRTMEHCLEQLSADQRQVIELFYLKEKCYKEITLETGIEGGKVRSFIQNGRRNLKKCMDKTIVQSS